MRTLLHVRRPDGKASGEIFDYSQFDSIIRRRNVGTWSLRMPRGDKADELSQSGYGIIVTRDDEEIFAGPINMTEPKFDIGTDETVISGFDDNIILWDQLVYPSAPNWADPDFKVFSNDAYDVRNGNAETIMKEYVEANFADADRRVPDTDAITVGANLTRGSNYIGRGRFQFLGDLLNEIAVAAGDLNFFVRNAVFDVSEPRDLRQAQVFSVESGNLSAFSFTRKGPTVSDVINAGGGEAEDRVFVRRRDTAREIEWNRHIEVLKDARDTTDPVELAQRGNQVLVDGAEATTVDIRAIDVPNRAFGKNWNVNDYVTIGDIEAVVGQAKFTLDENGETITPTIDSVTTVTVRSMIALYDTIRAMNRKINDLQRTR